MEEEENKGKLWNDQIMQNNKQQKKIKVGSDQTTA